MSHQEKFSAEDRMAMAEALLSTAKGIEKYGWQCIGVFDDDPCFTYTVGLTETYDHPELILFSIQHKVAHQFFSQIVKEKISKGEKIIPGIFYDDIAQGYDTFFIEANEEAKEGFMGIAVAAYDDTFRGLQMVFPDISGKFPWDRDSDPATLGKQPLLGTYGR